MNDILYYIIVKPRYAMTMEAGSSSTKSRHDLDELRSSPGLLLALLGQHAMRSLRKAHTAHNLKPRQFQLLGLLREDGALSQGDLRREMDIDPSILVTLLNPLEDSGLVCRDRDPDDRRRHLVTLTASGEREFESAMRAQLKAEDVLFASLDNGQREELRDLLVALAESAAGDEGSSCPPPLQQEECCEEDASG
jgi:DNA-binding MarR family transcriptional regulator